jgi:hypothetical protein
MQMEDLAKRFVNEIKLRGRDDKYIDRKEEREILQIAIEAGVSIENAAACLLQQCEASNFVLESEVVKKLAELLETFYEGDGKISEKEFNDAVTVAKKSTKGVKTERDCKRMVIEIMEEKNYNKIKHSAWFSDWYKNAKKDVGMA